MPMAERSANVIWKGDLVSGNGTLRFESSGAVGDLPVSWAARTEQPGGKTSPEELLAAAHASCYAMAFSNGLAKAGSKPEQLEVRATCTLDSTDQGPRVTTMRIEVRGRVPGMDAGRFRALADEAGAGCPISNAISGNVRIDVDASLES